jgi:hypothetical protein
MGCEVRFRKIESGGSYAVGTKVEKSQPGQVISIYRKISMTLGRDEAEPVSVPTEASAFQSQQDHQEPLRNEGLFDFQ